MGDVTFSTIPERKGTSKPASSLNAFVIPFHFIASTNTWHLGTGELVMGNGSDLANYRLPIFICIKLFVNWY
jgi:hypothetical protein